MTLVPSTPRALSRRSVAAVTFDATGTLIHAPRLAPIYSEVLKRHGISLDDDQIEALFPVVWKEMDCQIPAGEDRFLREPGGARAFWLRLLTRLCALAEVPAPSRFAAQELFDRFGRAESWEVYDDVRPCLLALVARGLPLGVISNWDQRLPTLLDRLDLSPFFRAVIVSSEVGVAKPSPDIFRLAADRLRVPFSGMLHVGDGRINDLEGARAAGCRALLLNRSGEGDINTLAETVLHLKT